jgi:hypothetical protein
MIQPPLLGVVNAASAVSARTLTCRALRSENMGSSSTHSAASSCSTMAATIGGVPRAAPMPATENHDAQISQLSGDAFLLASASCSPAAPRNQPRPHCRRQFRRCSRTWRGCGFCAKPTAPGGNVAAADPMVYANGAPLARSAQRAVFFHDFQPGTYRLKKRLTWVVCRHSHFAWPVMPLA